MLLFFIVFRGKVSTQSVPCLNSVALHWIAQVVQCKRAPAVSGPCSKKLLCCGRSNENERKRSSYFSIQEKPGKN